MTAAVKVDIDLLSGVVEKHRSWLAYSEIDLLRDFEIQAWSGWCLSAHQRHIVEGMIQSALDRRDVAMALGQRAS